MQEPREPGTDELSVEATLRLADREQLRALKARYCRYVDTKQWTALRGLFDESARFEGFGSAPDGCGPDEFVAGVATRLAPAVSVHACHGPEFVFESTDRARGVWAMTDTLEWPAGHAPSEAPDAIGFVGHGHYEERYVLVGGEWRFEFMRLTRLRITPIDRASPPLGARRQASTDWI